CGLEIARTPIVNHAGVAPPAPLAKRSHTAALPLAQRSFSPIEHGVAANLLPLDCGAPATSAPADLTPAPPAARNDTPRGSPSRLSEQERHHVPRFPRFRPTRTARRCALPRSLFRQWPMARRRQRHD